MLFSLHEGDPNYDPEQKYKPITFDNCNLGGVL